MKISHRGFAALIMVIIVSFTLLALCVGSSLALFSLRSENLERIQKLQSSAFAEACLDYAALRLIQDSSFTVVQPYSLSLATGSCLIESIVSSGSQFTITAYAESGKTHTTFVETLDLSDRNNPNIVNFIEN